MPSAGVVDATLVDVVESLVVSHPGCPVGAFDWARNLIDPRPRLASLGIDLDGHPALEGGALVEFVATSDAWLMSDAARDSTLHGMASRSIRLRDGRFAQLHLVDIGLAELRTVIVIVPDSGEAMASSPPPTAVVASSRVGVLRVDAVGSVTTAAGAALALLGRDPNESIAGMPIMNALHPDDHEVGIVNWVAAKEQRGVAHRWRCRIVRADGSPLAVEVTMTNNIDTTGNGEVVVELYDISQEVAVTEALAEEKALLGLLTETLPVGVAKFDANGEIEHVNGRLWQLLAPDEPHDVFVRAIRGELEVRELSAVFRRVLDDGVGGRVVVEHAGGEHGEPVHLEWTLRPVVSDMGEVTGGVVCVADITEATNLRAALEHRARTDALTGCLNRAGTLAAIDHALVGAALEGVGLLFIDLDGFKHVNDAQGHAVGDAVLEIVASRLRGAVRDGDLVGRLGGDEFVVIAPRLHSASAALGLAHRVAEQLHGVATIGACTVDIAASIGVAWSRAASAGGLLADADAAMYAAKQTRSGRPVLAAC